ncbi:MAG: hypothetical protein K6B65_02255 [Bacilli bacterium]|nr:hypothetical protein [Bacilli bacterium]
MENPINLFPSETIEVNPVFSLFPREERSSLSRTFGDAKASIKVPLGPSPIKRRIIVSGNRNVVGPYLFALATKAKAYNYELIAYCVAGLPREVEELGVKVITKETKLCDASLPTYVYYFKKDFKAASTNDLIEFALPCASKYVCFNIESDSQSITSDLTQRDYITDFSRQMTSISRDGVSFWGRRGTEFKGSENLSHESYKPKLGSYIKDNLVMALLDECFQDESYKKPFYIDTASTSLLFEECVKALLSSVGPLDGNISFSMDNDLSQFRKLGRILHDGKAYQMLPKTQTDVSLDKFDGKVYFGAFLSQEEALEKAREIKSLGLALDKAIFLINDPSLLSFYEEALSSYLGFKAVVISSLSAFPCVNFSYRKEEAIRRTHAHRYLVDNTDFSTMSYPLSEDAIWGLYLPDFKLYCYDYANYSPIYSPILFYDETSKRGGDFREIAFAEEDRYIVDKIARGERINSVALYCATYPLYKKKDSLLYAFANYEHIYWARRTIFHRDNYRDKPECLADLNKLIDRVKFDQYSRSNLDSDKLSRCLSEDVVWLDFGTIFNFISLVCRDFSGANLSSPLPILNTKSIKEALKDPNGDEAILRQRLSYRDILSFYLENPSFDFGEFGEARFVKKPKITLPNLVDCPSFYYALPLSYLEKVPNVGDIFSIQGHRVMVLDSYKVNNGSFLKCSLSIQEYEDDSKGFGLASFLARNATDGDDSIVVLRLLAFPSLFSPLNDKGIGSLLSLVEGANIDANSPLFALMKIRLVAKFDLGEAATKEVERKLGESLYLNQAPFVRVLDPLSITSYHYQMAYHYNEYSEIGLNLTATLADIARCIDPLPEKFPYDENLGYIGPIKVKQSEKPSHVMIPFAVADHSFAHIISLLLNISELEAKDVLDGKLLFNKALLGNGELDLKSGTISFYDAFDDILPILKGEKGELAKKIYSSFLLYPYGDNAEKLLFLRLAKLGLISRNSFYHNVLPVTNDLKNAILSKSPYLGTYGEALLNTLHSLKYFEESKGKDNKERQNIVKYANECFLTLYFSHYIASFYFEEGEEQSGLAVKRFAGILKEACVRNKKEAIDYIISLRERATPLLSVNVSKREGEYALMAAFFEISPKEDIDNAYSLSAKTDKHFLANMPSGIEEHYYGLRPCLYYLYNRTVFDSESSFNATYVKEASIEEVDPPEEVELTPFEELGPTVFLVKGTFNYRRSEYYLLYPKVSQSWIKTDEFLFAYKKIGGDKPYYIVTNNTELKAVYDAANSIMGGNDDEDDDDDF